MTLWLRRVFMCWWGGCSGLIEYDRRGGTVWRCPRCDKVVTR